MKIGKLVLIAGVVLFSFALCLLLAMLVKEYFQMTVDFLSSGATLSAAFIAIILFNDWRDQHKVTLMDAFHSDLKGSIESVFKIYSQILIEVRKFNGTSDQGAVVLCNDVQNVLSDFNESLVSMDTLTFRLSNFYY